MKEEKGVIKRGGKRKGVTDSDYKAMKQEAFAMYLEDPYLGTKQITDILNRESVRVNPATVSRWMHSQEWHNWFMESMGESGKALKVGALSLYKKSISYCNDLLDKNLTEEEAKSAGPTIKLIGHLFEHAGIINQKPFMEVHQTNINQVNNSVQITEDTMKNWSPEEITNYLTRREVPQLPEPTVLIEEADYIMEETVKEKR
jgi:hypothetical protein